MIKAPKKIINLHEMNLGTSNIHQNMIDTYGQQILEIKMLGGRLGND